MSGCVARRWAGTGTTGERSTDPLLAKEMNDRLKNIQAERSKMDAAFTTTDNQVVIFKSQPNDKIEIPIYDKAKTRGF